jgi:N-acetylneuraminate synthase
MDFDTAQFYFRPEDEPVAIAEAGVNHNCDMGIAKKMIRAAQKAGAHIIKFQAFVSEEEISKFAEKADYQKETTGASGGQLEMAKALELDHAQLRSLRSYCHELNQPFLCTAFESISLDFLVNDLGVKALKIASSEVTNHPFLAEIARSKVGIILSTGASTLDEASDALRVLQQAGGKEIVMLHCVSQYPANMAEINLRAMHTMRQALGVPIGYSDHTAGFEAPIIAAALGAVTVEKHFTLDRNMPGPDHKASIEPDELAIMVRGMKAAHMALGDGVKQPVSCEKDNRPLIRKSIVVRRDLAKGHVICEADLAYKRPANGLAPFEAEKVIGKTLNAAMEEDEPLQWSLIA